MVRTLIFMVFSVFPVLLFSQELIVPEKKLFIAENGRIYIQKEQPVYLWVSTSPGKDAEKIRLTSEETENYTNPMYFDTEGYNSIRSPWAVEPESKNIVIPKQELVFEVYADSKAPASGHQFLNKAPFREKEHYYFKPGVEIGLSAHDVHSGVNAIYYSINKAAYLTYKDPIILSDEKEYLIKYYSVDNVGNMEDIDSLLIKVDGKPPATSLDIEGDFYDDILSARSSIILEASDNNIIENIHYKIDNGEESVYNRPIKMNALKQGEHSITYYSVDKVNNIEDKHTYAFYVDKSPPKIVEELIGNSFISNGKEYSSGRVKFKITTFDNKAGVKDVFYAINGNEYQKYSAPFYLDEASGNINIKTYAVDKVNNKSYDEESNNVTSDIPYIDLSGPALHYKFAGPSFEIGDSIYINKKTKITLLADDSESGVNLLEYQIDGKPAQKYTEPFFIETEGRHRISIRGTDNVQNVNQKEINLIVDNSGPDIYTRFSINPRNAEVKNGKTYEIYPKHVVLYISSTDHYVGVDQIYYKINDGQQKLYSSLIRDFSEGQDYNLRIEVSDKLGNINTREVNFSTMKF